MSAQRLARVHGLLADEALDALIVEGAANLRYLTGYTGSNGLALVLSGGGEDRFLTDFRYASQIAEELEPSLASEIIGGDLLDAIAERLPAGRVGFDDAQLSVRRHARLRGLVGDGTELVAASGLIERLRAVKDETEIETIARAAAVVHSVCGWIAERGLGGRTEREVAVALEHELRLRGASAPSFDSIVASGPHGALPHASPRDVPIERGSLVVIDFGAVVEGYCSDCTRTFAVGEVGERAREVYATVLAAQIAGLDAVVPGATGPEADAHARAVIDDAGYGEHFGHGLGHGVGLEIHEAPRLSRTASEDPLVAGNVVTVEPGIYLPGELGVRIEDLVVVREGRPQVLGGFTKELLTLD
jgi:Xaa-Pro aminopeptidase